MKTILIRSGKEPWTPISPEATLAGNVLGTNAGNSLFSTAIFSTLSVPGHVLESDYFQIERSRRPNSMVGEVDDRYDQIVIPLANAFRASFVPYLDRWSELIEGSITPATVVGVGGQFALSGGTPSASRAVQDSTNRFMRAVLKRSASVGVRGEITYDYLRSLGYSDDEVDIIGCPSLYRPDIPVQVTKGRLSLSRDARIALNVTPVMSVAKGHNDTMGRVIELNMELYRNLEYFPQENSDLRQFLWNHSRTEPHSAGMPVSRDHRLFTEGRAHMFVDPHTWIDHLSKFEFAFGNRIHGNIAALLAGVPSVVLAFDSRLKELAMHHSIPTIPINELTPSTTAEDLHAEADFASFNQRHVENVLAYRAFLAKNDLDHGFEAEAEGSIFRSRFEDVIFPRAIGPFTAENATEQLSRRVQWLQNEIRTKKSPLELRRHMPSWSAQQKVNVREVDAGWRIDQLNKEMDTLSLRIHKMEGEPRPQASVGAEVRYGRLAELVARQSINSAGKFTAHVRKKLRSARILFRRFKNRQED